MQTPRLTATSITIGTSQPLRLADFYSRLLGLPVTAEEPAGSTGHPDAGWAQIRSSGGPTLNFEYERHHVRPVWPTRPGEQNPTQHLDIHAPDLDAAVEWAVSLGAVLAEYQPQDEVRVLFDPDGHPFCLFT
ncbi:catechol 2,3-dioxygenase-like lactoylglutathione lyase family enzyme [Stackebrandtia endophytica]|uniref:Catechol 2,3-dioxygenase-like lactoylglutathione lyase family enzyme n=1 Tax=Stackebrandtia endophytica TaxID=1496996 RepID=A0A543AXJ2_9ACTN|nr:VOC family protein [Stackebrandtia endophytica]TQL77273.1 catechol 2,3-dioxygenase-like lactoylglutathione lyase family enzyme [Stackebrandtia endophytica]